VKNLLAPSGVLSRLPAHNAAVLTGRQFFPHLISVPFHHGLVIVFTAAAIMSVTGALVSLLRGKQFYYDDKAPSVPGSKIISPNGLGSTSPAGRSPAEADGVPSDSRVGSPAVARQDNVPAPRNRGA
jgi:hypothetical protein